MASYVPPLVPSSVSIAPGIYSFTSSGGIAPSYFDYSDLRVFNGTIVPTFQDFSSFGTSLKSAWYDPFLSGNFTMMNMRTCAEVANIKAQCAMEMQNPYNIDFTS